MGSIPTRGNDLFLLPRSIQKAKFFHSTCSALKIVTLRPVQILQPTLKFAQAHTWDLRLKSGFQGSTMYLHFPSLLVLNMANQIKCIQIMYLIQLSYK